MSKKKVTKPKHTPDAKRHTVKRQLRLSLTANNQLMELVEARVYDADGEISCTVENIIGDAYRDWKG